MPNKFITNKLRYNEKYHDNCHDYLGTFYLEKYALVTYKPLLVKIMEKIPKINICNEMSEHLYHKIIVCDQHAVVFGYDSDVFPILATYALNACIGLVMYAPLYKISALAHIDGLPGYSLKSAKLENVDVDFCPVTANINIMLDRIRLLAKTTDKEKIDIKYYLIGGIFDMSEIMINDIIECINNIANMNNKNNKQYKFIFAGRNLLGPENQSRNICINSANGKITYFNYITNSEIYHMNRSKDGLPINIIKAPRKSEAMLDITYCPLL